MLYNTNGQYIMKYRKKYTFKEKDPRFSGSVGMGILWGFPQVILWYGTGQPYNFSFAKVYALRIRLSK